MGCTRHDVQPKQPFINTYGSLHVARARLIKSYEIRSHCESRIAYISRVKTRQFHTDSSKAVDSHVKRPTARAHSGQRVLRPSHCALAPQPEIPGFASSDGQPSATIEAPENSGDNIYVRFASSSLDGTPLDRSWVTYDELISGGKLRLSMASEPDTRGNENISHWTPTEL